MFKRDTIRSHSFKNSALTVMALLLTVPFSGCVELDLPEESELGSMEQAVGDRFDGSRLGGDDDDSGTSGDQGPVLPGGITVASVDFQREDGQVSFEEYGHPHIIPHQNTALVRIAGGENVRDDSIEVRGMVYREAMSWDDCLIPVDLELDGVEHDGHAVVVNQEEDYPGIWSVGYPRIEGELPTLDLDTERILDDLVPARDIFEDGFPDDVNPAERFVFDNANDPIGNWDFAERNEIVVPEGFEEIVLGVAPGTSGDGTTPPSPDSDREPDDDWRPEEHPFQLYHVMELTIDYTVDNALGGSSARSTTVRFLVSERLEEDEFEAEFDIWAYMEGNDDIAFVEWPPAAYFSGGASSPVPMSSLNIGSYTSTNTPIEVESCEYLDVGREYWHYEFQANDMANLPSEVYELTAGFAYDIALLPMYAIDALGQGTLYGLNMIPAPEGTDIATYDEEVESASGIRITDDLLEVLAGEINRVYVVPDDIFDGIDTAAGCSATHDHIVTVQDEGAQCGRFDNTTNEINDNTNSRSGVKRHWDNLCTHDDWEQSRVDLYRFEFDSELTLGFEDGSFAAGIVAENFQNTTRSDVPHASEFPLLRAWYEIGCDGSDPYVLDVQTFGSNARMRGTLLSGLSVTDGYLEMTDVSASIWDENLNFNWGDINYGGMDSMNMCAHGDKICVDDAVADFGGMIAELFGLIDDEIDDLENELEDYLEEDLAEMINAELTALAEIQSVSTTIPYPQGGEASVSASCTFSDTHNVADDTGANFVLDADFNMGGHGNWLVTPPDRAIDDVLDELDAESDGFDAIVAVNDDYINKALSQIWSSGYLDGLIPESVDGIYLTLPPVAYFPGEGGILNVGIGGVLVGPITVGDESYRLSVSAGMSVQSAEFSQVEGTNDNFGLTVVFDESSVVYSWQLYETSHPNGHRLMNLSSESFAECDNASETDPFCALVNDLEETAEESIRDIMDRLEAAIFAATVMTLDESFQFRLTVSPHPDFLLVAGEITSLRLD